MFLHVGNNKNIRIKNIIGIFDMDNASWAYKTREFLDMAQEEGRVIWVCDDLPRSFVVTDNGSENWQVYVSQLSSATLMGRAEKNGFE